MAGEPSFEWDAAKDRDNQAKHGVSFSQAQHAFFDPRRVIAEDLDHSATEQRYFWLRRGGWWRDDGAVHVARRSHPYLRSGLLAEGKANL